MARPQKQRPGPERVDGPRIALAVGLTRLGMFWAQAARAFWPLLVVLAVLIAVLAFGLFQSLDRIGVIVAFAVALIAAALALAFGLRRYHTPSEAEARARVDASLPGRPLSALDDEMALGGDDPGAQALWRAHLRRMRAVAADAAPIAPDADLPRRDPFALRLAGATALAMAMLFAPPGQIGQGIAALGASLRPMPPSDPVTKTGPGWEGWAQPPAYTRRPTIYLNALPLDSVLTLPKGSVVSFRLYGEGGKVTQSIGPDARTDDPAAPEFTAEKDGVIEVTGRSFPVVVMPDDAPQVQPGKAPTRRADGRLIQEFSASDDNGVKQGVALIALDLGAVDRRFGLTVEPEPRDPLSLNLPLRAGQRKKIQGQLVADLARHPWANLPVQIRLQVEDDIGQEGTSAPMQMVLPGRRFFDPLAAALIEMRRDLLWSRENAGHTARVLRAVSWEPEGFMDEASAETLREAITTLESGPLDDKTRDALAETLWQAAVQLEDGGLADALERMQQAQERLSEAIRNGASEDEIRQLMNELREATDAYTDMLAQQEKDPAERFDRSPKDQRQRVTGSQLQDMMDEIQRLMNEGRMAEAQELLERFNQLMQNLKVDESEESDGAGRPRPSDRLADTLREQQRLSDDAMRDLQNRFMQDFPGAGQEQGQEGQQQGEGQPQGQDGAEGEPGQQGQSGSNGQPGQNGQPSPGEGEGPDQRSLADRQRDLREELGRQRGLLPGRGTEQGDRAGRSLDDAGRAMEEAEQALRDDDFSSAMERQAQAIQSMREGLRALGDLASREGQQGQNGEQGQQQGAEGQGEDGPASDPSGRRGLAGPNSRQSGLDPLGRSMTGQGNQLPNGDPLSDAPDPTRQARDLVDEIRRRLGQRERGSDERDYLGRLLDRF